MLLAPALLRYSIEAARIDHAAVGFGDHHWTVLDTAGRRWFATVADLTDKPHAPAGLGVAMEVATELAERLPFVVAPVRTSDDDVLVALTGRWALTVFPFVDGEPGTVDGVADPATLDLLAALHDTPAPTGIPTTPAQPGGRVHLDAALVCRRRPWSGGPYAEPARALLREHAGAVEAALDAFDADQPAAEPVVTHGEPHPGNLLRTATGLRLVDWDTVGLAPPERDLWHVLSRLPTTERAALLERYGRPVDQRAVAWYARRWDIDDIGLSLAWFRAPHTRDPDTETAWHGLRGALDRLL